MIFWNMFPFSVKSGDLLASKEKYVWLLKRSFPRIGSGCLFRCFEQKASGALVRKQQMKNCMGRALSFRNLWSTLSGFIIFIVFWVFFVVRLVPYRRLTEGLFCIIACLEVFGTKSFKSGFLVKRPGPWVDSRYLKHIQGVQCFPLFYFIAELLR